MEEGIANGLSAEGARRVALGGLEQQKEACRDPHGVRG